MGVFELRTAANNGRKNGGYEGMLMVVTLGMDPTSLPSVRWNQGGVYKSMDQAVIG